nr:unnamed protein product [Callosobruchus chinensis]
MLSGIGPKDHLGELGIEVLENLEVGSTFRDHLMTQVFIYNFCCVSKVSRGPR